MKLAVIETGGKQYLVSEGQKIQVEKLEGEAGAKFDFSKVLAISEGEKVNLGKPYIDGKKISAEIIAQKRLPKVITFKYHSKTRFRKKTGHRQPVSVVKILAI